MPIQHAFHQHHHNHHNHKHSPHRRVSATPDDLVTGQSVAKVIKNVLMVPPDHFEILYHINPEMGGVVDKKLARVQWNALKEAIEEEGIHVGILEPSPGLPDEVFVCNSGLVYGHKVYLSHFAHKERVGEEPKYQQWFEEHGFQLFGVDHPKNFEGGGDAVFSDYNTLWASYGPRTTRSVYKKMQVLGDFDIVIVHHVDERFYHLDTCFSPIDETTAIWYPPAFSKHTQQEILRRMPDSIAVSEEEALSFVCNCICLRNTVISPIGVSDATRAALDKRGFKVKEVDMSEFMKSGGACQCLVLRL